MQSNFKIRNYDTNKLESFFINNFNWEKDYNFISNINTKLLGNIKNINYETKNVALIKMTLQMNYSELWVYYPKLI